MKKLLLIGAAAVALAACSQNEDSSSGASGEMVDAASTDSASPQVQPDRQGEAREAMPASIPQLAYEYAYSYRLGSAEINPLMRRHANLCEQQGPQSCRILGMDLKGSAERDDIRGTLTLGVAASHARALGALLEDEALETGAEQLSANIASDELSKQIVDTEARIRARTQLRDRLMGTLETRKGSVAELVEAERSVAQVNEEIDQAQSWLKEMEGRIAYSRVTLSYESGMAPANDFMTPVKSAVGSVGSILGFVAAALILLLAVGGPLALLYWLVQRGRRRLSLEG